LPRVTSRRTFYGPFPLRRASRNANLGLGLGVDILLLISVQAMARQEARHEFIRT
jgi:hypothetical protein